VDKEEEIVSLKLLVGSLNSSNNNPEEPFLTIPSKGKGLKLEPKRSFEQFLNLFDTFFNLVTFNVISSNME
jgi:hypothetical protein